MPILYCWLFLTVLSIQATVSANAERFSQALKSKNPEQIIAFLHSVEITSVEAAKIFSEEMLKVARDIYGSNLDEKKLSELMKYMQCDDPINTTYQIVPRAGI